MTRCEYCKENTAHQSNNFSGLKKKSFCQGCWSKIYTVYKGLNFLEQEPQILNMVLKITEPEIQ